MFPATSSQLRSFNIGGNRLKEFNGFTRWNVPNVKIVDIDTNQFNCTFVKHIFRRLSWRNIDSLTIWVNCGIQNEEIESYGTLDADEIPVQAISNPNKKEEEQLTENQSSGKNNHIIGLPQYQSYLLIIIFQERRRTYN